MTPDTHREALGPLDSGRPLGVSAHRWEEGRGDQRDFGGPLEIQGIHPPAPGRPLRPPLGLEEVVLEKAPSNRTSERSMHREGDCQGPPGTQGDHEATLNPRAPPGRQPDTARDHWGPGETTGTGRKQWEAQPTVEDAPRGSKDWE